MDAGRESSFINVERSHIGTAFEQRRNLRLALRWLQRAGGVDQLAAGLEPACNPIKQRALQFSKLGNLPRFDAVDNIGVAAENAGSATWRIQQNGIGWLVRLPGCEVSSNDIGR